MTTELRLQRIFDRVELVSGIGDAERGQMCVMSFVACLTGEGRTDSPGCASAVIRSFAIPLNDQMPYGERQRLKPFVPRIIGTNDGLDEARLGILRRALAEEILPRLEGAAGTRPRPLAWLWRGQLHRRARALVDCREYGHRWSGQDLELASVTGRLLARCAHAATTAAEAEWYWSQGIRVLDELCDVGAKGQPRPQPRPDRVEWLDTVLTRRRSIGRPADAGPEARNAPEVSVGF